MACRIAPWTSVVLAALACGAACGDPSEQLTPVATVRHFLEIMERSTDESALEEAYRMLDASAQKALAERAERATTLAGRRYEPWQMLSQGRYRQRFAPASTRGMREQVTGERAVVTVSSTGGHDRAEVALVREQGAWRIVLAIPPMRTEPRHGDGREG